MPTTAFVLGRGGFCGLGVAAVGVLLLACGRSALDALPTDPTTNGTSAGPKPVSGVVDAGPAMPAPSCPETNDPVERVTLGGDATSWVDNVAMVEDRDGTVWVAQSRVSWVVAPRTSHVELLRVRGNCVDVVAELNGRKNQGTPPSVDIALGPDRSVLVAWRDQVFGDNEPPMRVARYDVASGQWAMLGAPFGLPGDTQGARWAPPRLIVSDGTIWALVVTLDKGVLVFEWLGGKWVRRDQVDGFGCDVHGEQFTTLTGGRLTRYQVNAVDGLARIRARGPDCPSCSDVRLFGEDDALDVVTTQYDVKAGATSLVPLKFSDPRSWSPTQALSTIGQVLAGAVLLPTGQVVVGTAYCTASLTGRCVRDSTAPHLWVARPHDPWSALPATPNQVTFALLADHLGRLLVAEADVRLVTRDGKTDSAWPGAPAYGPLTLTHRQVPP